MSEADRIEVRGLRVVATHGVLDSERERPQPFELDLDVWVAAGTGRSDRLEETVDYGAVVTRTSSLVRRSSFGLMEALADAVAAEILSLDDRVEAVEVAVHKLRPPVAEDLRSAGVRVLRRRGRAPEGR